MGTTAAKMYLRCIPKYLWNQSKRLKDLIMANGIRGRLGKKVKPNSRLFQNYVKPKLKPVLVGLNQNTETMKMRCSLYLVLIVLLWVLSMVQVEVEMDC